MDWLDFTDALKANGYGDKPAIISTADANRATITRRGRNYAIKVGATSGYVRASMVDADGRVNPAAWSMLNGSTKMIAMRAARSA